MWQGRVRDRERPFTATLASCGVSGYAARVWRTLVDWLLPPRCGACGALGAWLCDRCRSRVRLLREPLCGRCGRELTFVAQPCNCRVRLRSLRHLRAAAAYEGPLERALQRFKYSGWSGLAPLLAGLLCERLSLDADPPSGFLLAVPLHRRRQRARGYNQAELIAGRLRSHFSSPRPPGRLVRIRDTPSQIGLDRVQRRENVAAAFAWQGPPLDGCRLAVVDDVATTGATLEACAVPLMAAGAGVVVGLTVARAQG